MEPRISVYPLRPDDDLNNLWIRMQSSLRSVQAGLPKCNQDCLFYKVDVNVVSLTLFVALLYVVLKGNSILAHACISPHLHQSFVTCW